MTKQKLEIATVPTVADLKAKRLELTRASLHERLLAGGLDDVRVIVESLAREFDVLDVAGDSRKELQVEDLIAMFRRIRGQTLDDDALLIG